MDFLKALAVRLQGFFISHIPLVHPEQFQDRRLTLAVRRYDDTDY